MVVVVAVGSGFEGGVQGFGSGPDAGAVTALEGV